MKELCSCNCCASAASPFVTPWCELLKNQEESCSVLHLWYKLDMVREEIEKRTSVLGKLRRTEEAQHLLDLIAMTEDEKPMFLPFAKAAMSDVFEILAAHMPKHEKALWWREGQETAVFSDDPALPSPPVKYYAGQYVEYNGNLYMAIEDGDSDDFATKIVPSEDYRDSIHYGILWNCSSNINAVEPLDVSVFEAIVARIIYKWLQYSYPEEAARYLNEYNEYLAQIKNRARILEGAKIVNRIPSY